MCRSTNAAMPCGVDVICVGVTLVAVAAAVLNTASTPRNAGFAVVDARRDGLKSRAMRMSTMTMCTCPRAHRAGIPQPEGGEHGRAPRRERLVVGRKKRQRFKAAAASGHKRWRRSDARNHKWAGQSPPEYRRLITHPPTHCSYCS